MFDSLSAKFAGAFSALRGKGRLKAGDLADISAEIKRALLDSDVSISVAEKFVAKIEERSLAVLDAVSYTHLTLPTIYSV